MLAKIQRDFMLVALVALSGTLPWILRPLPSYNCSPGDSSCDQTVVSGSSFMRPPITTESTNVQSAGKRELLVPEGHYGLSNQMACLNLAAVLAVQYNRTLVVPSNGVSGNRVHGLFPVPFKRVYNVDYASTKIPMRIDTFGSQMGYQGFQRRLPPQCANNTIMFRMKKIRETALASDPFENEECATLICHWTRIRFVAPPDLFPHVDNVYFRYNEIYRQAAIEVIETIRSKVKSAQHTQFRLLSLHVRRGDRGTVPLFDCQHDLKDFYPYPHVVKNEQYPVVCSNSSRHRGKDWEHTLTWERFFQLMGEPQCKQSKFPICASDFDALFVGTNDPPFVRYWAAKSGLPVFLIGDFKAIHKKYLLPETLQSEKIEEAAEMLLIEEMVMVESYQHVPSFESSITQQVLRLRLDLHPNDWDKHLLDTYYVFRSNAHKKRWPDDYNVPLVL